MLKNALVFLFIAVLLRVGSAAEPERSVIQIMTFSQQPVWDAPWRSHPVQRSGGSGFVIKGKRIMTNAHVVSWAKQIIVRRYQDPRPYVALVEYVGHDCDLAVLKPEDSRFFDGLEPLEIGDLPKVRSGVVTYGYPAGGEEISYTRGVVSRIELEPYSHIGNRRLLSVQTDAAINPGNSGGPVIQDDKVVGVAFQGLPGLENAGFFIPQPVIEHFLKDIEDKHYDGFPYAGLRVMALQSPAYRSFLRLPDNDVGARIDGILPIATTQKALQVDDVLLKIGPYRVASDGTILYQGNRLSSALAFQLAQSGDTVPLQVWRDGKEVQVSLPVSFYEGDCATGYKYDVVPRYYVYGGLVFTPLTLDYLRTLGNKDTPGEDFYELFYRPHETPESLRPEPIVLASVLADEVNANVGVRTRALIDKINGVRIEKLDDVIKAFATNTNAYDTIVFVSHQGFESLNRKDVARANPTILNNYGITKDRSL